MLLNNGHNGPMGLANGWVPWLPFEGIPFWFLISAGAVGSGPRFFIGELVESLKIFLVLAQIAADGQ